MPETNPLAPRCEHYTKLGVFHYRAQCGLNPSEVLEGTLEDMDRIAALEIVNTWTRENVERYAREQPRCPLWVYYLLP